MSNEQKELPTQAVEVNLTDNSVLVLEYPGYISQALAEDFKQRLRDTLAKRGLQIIVLSDGITCKVLQRQDMDLTP